MRMIYKAAAARARTQSARELNEKQHNMYKLAVISAVLCIVMHAYAITQEEKNNIKAAMQPFTEECAKQFGTTLDELKALREAGKLNEVDGCLLACVAKKAGILNNGGMYDPQVEIEMTKKFLSDPADIAKATQITKACASVNEETVSDGSKGCDRAKLLTVCFQKHKDEIVGI